jgi:hypothetical protein
MFTRAAQPGPAAPAKPSAPPAKHGAPMHKGGHAPVDHKGAIQKMHPEHVHRLVQDAHAGKFGPEAQKTAQMAMQPQQGQPMNDGDQDNQQQPQARAASIFGNGAPAAPAAPAGPPSRASMF